MKYFWSIFFAFLCALGAYQLTLQKGFVNPYPIVCDLVAEKIYLDDEAIKPWQKTCLKRSRLVTPTSSKALIIKDLNNVFGLLKVSHLEIYDSREVRSIWSGESLQTGIESEFVDSELIILKVQRGSPAAKLGLKVGDIVKTINKEQPNPWEAQTVSGIYELVRAKKSWVVNIKADSLLREEKIETQDLGKQKSLIRVPSFRAEFFSKGEIERLSLSLRKSKLVIVDLRGNAGGNFVAGLRFLSLFMCEPTEIGRLIKPRYPQKNETELVNDLRDEEQIKMLNTHRELVLKTFARDTCYKGPVRVLVDGKAASVAEMVAQALKERRQALIEGAPTRGQLLVGVWYPVGEVSPGVQISIPEALYMSVGQHRIEGQGVQLDRTLDYKLGEMQAGIDSWVQRVLD